MRHIAGVGEGRLIRSVEASTHSLTHSNWYSHLSADHLELLERAMRAKFAFNQKA